MRQRGFIPILIIIIVSLLAVTSATAVAVSKGVDLPKVAIGIVSTYIQPTINNVVSKVTYELSTVTQNQIYVPNPTPTETTNIPIANSPSPLPTSVPTPFALTYTPTVKCLGADGLYSYVTQEVCDSVKKYWDAHPTSTTSPNTSSSSTTSSTDSSTPEPTATPQAVTSDLTDLVISGSPSNYTFTGSTYNYTGVTVPSSASPITITPTGSGTITVEGVEVVSGQASGSIALTEGVEKTITITVTESGKSMITYTIKITRNSPVSTSSGPLSPGTVVDDATVGTIAWINPNNVMLSDNTYTTLTTGPVSFLGHRLNATNFGFSIPAAATIDGIVIDLEGYRTYTSGSAGWALKIIKGGVVGTTNPVPSNTVLPFIESSVTNGNSTFKWGLTWTVADINASNFGVSYRIGTIFDDNMVGVQYLDNVRITVYYTY